MASVSLREIYKKYPGGVIAVSDFNIEIKDKEFMNELQFQINSFLSGNNEGDTHYYISQYKPTAIAMYFPDPNTIYAETIPLEIEKDDRY